MSFLELKHLRLVKSIVETGTISRASGVLNLTQPALSLQLSDIENKLETPLFKRIGKRLVLTPAGDILYEMAGKVLKDVETAEKTIIRIAGGRQFHLTIASVCLLSYKWLPSVIGQFQGRFPASDIEFRLTSDFASDLKQGVLDLVVVRKTDDDPAFYYEPVFSDEMVAVMKPDNPLAGKPFLNLEDCRGVDLVAFSDPDKDDLYHKFLKPAGIIPSRITRADQPEVLIELVKNGFGITILPVWSIKEYLNSGVLIAKQLSDNGVFFTWYLAMRSENRTDECYQWFIRTISRQGIV